MQPAETKTGKTSVSEGVAVARGVEEHFPRAGAHVPSLLPQLPERARSELKTGLKDPQREPAASQQALLAVKGQHVLLVSAGEDDGGSQVLREGLEPGHVEGAGAATLPADGQCAAAAPGAGVRHSQRSPRWRPCPPPPPHAPHRAN